VKHAETPPIYLDAFATTPVAPEVIDVVVARLGHTGNAHSPHLAGAEAASEVARARTAVADLIGADSQEIIFTSGATEANNLAVMGWARATARSGSRRRTIITTNIEHPSVLGAAAALTGEGFRHRQAPVGADGRLDLPALGTMLDEDVLLLAIMAANNITGVVQPVIEASALARNAGAFVHVDGAQAVGKIPVDVCRWDVDSLSLSGHKFHGPPGIGALFVSAAAPLKPLPTTFGGGQENGLRSGTLPVALICGLGVAANLSQARMDGDAVRLRELEARFLDGLRARQVRFQINGAKVHRLPGAMNLSICGLSADDLVTRLSGEVSLSTGSACSSGQIDVAPTLRHMKLNDAFARSALRVYFNRYSTDVEAADAAMKIAAAAAGAGLATGDIVQ
jgi:cysteine desulfurase